MKAMFGIAIKEKGEMEGVGIGSFDIEQADDLAGSLESLAESIRKSVQNAS